MAPDRQSRSLDRPDAVGEPSQDAVTPGEPGDDRRSGASRFLHGVQRRDADAISEGLERASRMVLAAAVLLVPIVLDSRTNDAFNLIKISTLWILGIVAFVLWRLSRSFGQRER